MTWTDLPSDIDSYLRNVHVKNVGTKDAVLYYNSVPYIIRVGHTVAIPFEALCIWCGDPRATDEPRVIRTNGERMFVPSRNDEVARLRALYGMHSIGAQFEILTGEDPETGQFIDYPRLEVWDGADPPERLWTVLEDPEGVKTGRVMNPHVARVERDRAQVITRLEQELALLKEQVAREGAGFAPPGHTPYTPLSEADLPQDDAPDPTAPVASQRATQELDFPVQVPDLDHPEAGVPAVTVYDQDDPERGPANASELHIDQVPKPEPITPPTPRGRFARTK